MKIKLFINSSYILHGSRPRVVVLFFVTESRTWVLWFITSTPFSGRHLSSCMFTSASDTHGIPFTPRPSRTPAPCLERSLRFSHKGSFNVNLTPGSFFFDWSILRLPRRLIPLAVPGSDTSSFVTPTTPRFYSGHTDVVFLLPFASHSTLVRTFTRSGECRDVLKRRKWTLVSLGDYLDFPSL